MDPSTSKNNVPAKLGEPCTCCSGYREVKTTEKPPLRRLVKIGLTQNKKQVVLACEHCDGNLVTLAGTSTKE